MRFSATLLAIAGVVSAATTTTTAAASSATCAAQNVVDACLGSTKAILDNCAPNDWSCMCAAQQGVVTCYNNCPGDPDANAAQGEETSWCQAASQASAASSATMTGSKTSTSAFSAATLISSTTAKATNAGSGSTTTGTSAKATSTGAANIYGPAGGLAAIAIGVVGLL